VPAGLVEGQSADASPAPKSLDLEAFTHDRGYTIEFIVAFRSSTGTGDPTTEVKVVAMSKLNTAIAKLSPTVAKELEGMQASRQQYDE